MFVRSKIIVNLVVLVVHFLQSPGTVSALTLKVNGIVIETMYAHEPSKRLI